MDDRWGFERFHEQHLSGEGKTNEKENSAMDSFPVLLARCRFGWTNP